MTDDFIIFSGTANRDIAASMLDAGARPEITIAARHGLLLEDAREKLSHEARA